MCVAKTEEVTRYCAIGTSGLIKDKFIGETCSMQGLAEKYVLNFLWQISKERLLTEQIQMDKT